MLMHHGDAAGERVGRPRGAIGFAAKAHLAVIRHMHAENHIAESGLAGAVLAENAVHLARHNIERSFGHRHECAEPLGDACSASSGSVVLHGISHCRSDQTDVPRPLSL